MFIDRAKILVRSGAGGNGAVTFRRENMFHLEDQMVEMEEKVVVLYLQ